MEILLLQVGIHRESFEDWDTIVREKAELMAGNHRVEALKKCLQLSKCENREWWWICDFYDKGRTPLKPSAGVLYGSSLAQEG